LETNLIKFIKEQRKLARLTQPECARKAGVSLPFLRNLEQGKKSLQMDKVNKVLKLFGTELGVVKLPEL
jgi:y4mF family transcriptional regulator